MSSDAPKTKVFISYSRKDSVFAEELRDRLIGAGIDAFLDVHDIVKGEPWQERLRGLIGKADAVIFLVSPDSVSSSICDWEVNQAELLGKRILPVVCRPTPDGTIPLRLTRLNYTFLESKARNDAEFPKLLDALSEDLLWVRSHTALLERALHWQDRSRRPDELLRGTALADAEGWLVTRPAQNMAPTELHREYIAASRQAASGRRQALVISLTLGLVVAVALAGLATWQGLVAARERDSAETNWAGAIAWRAEYVNLEDPLVAMLMATEALPGGSDRPLAYVPQAEKALYSALFRVREVAALRGHTNDVMHGAFSPDGKRIVTAAADHSARLWDAQTGALLQVLEGHDSLLRYAEFSGDGRIIATAAIDGTARTWDALTGKPLQVFSGHAGIVPWARIDDRTRRLLTTDVSGTTRLWNLNDGTEIARFQTMQNQDAAALSRAGSLAALVGDDGKIRLIDLVTGATNKTLAVPGRKALMVKLSDDGQVMATLFEDRKAAFFRTDTLKKLSDVSAHEGGVDWVVLFPNGLLAFTFGKNGDIRLWGVPTGRAIEIGGDQSGSTLVPKADVQFRDATVSPTNRMVAFRTSDGALWLYDVLFGRWVERFARKTAVNSPNAPVNLPMFAAFDPSGASLLAGFRRGGDDGGVAMIWRADPVPYADTLIGHRGAVIGLAVSPDMTRLLTASFDASAGIWSLADGRPLLQLSGHTDRIYEARYSPDGRSIVTASGDGTALLWEAEAGTRRATLEHDGGFVLFTAFTADSRLVATAGNDGTARIWRTTDGQPVSVCQPHWGGPLSVAFNAAGNRLLTTDARNAILWSVPDCEQMLAFDADGQALSEARFFDTDRRIVAAAADGSLRIWDATSGETLATLTGHTQPVKRLAFSPDGSLLASAGEDGTIRLWPLDGTGPSQVLTGHTHIVTDVAFSGSGLRLASASFDKTARIWDVKSGQMLALLEGHTWAVSSVLINHDGTRIVTGSGDQTARIWTLFKTTEAVVEFAKSIAPRCLTERERTELFLPKEPPSWCRERNKWPYAQNRRP